MPANLPPQYHEAEKRYRSATDPEEKIEALQTMLAIMPKHKGTDKLHADLRRRIAKLTEEAEKQYATTRKGDTHRIRKEGAGQVVLVGLPNAGKSQLLTCVTEATSDTAPYPFTTQVLIPGMMKYENIQIQLVDAPAPTNRNARAWLNNTFRNADALLLVIDLGEDPLDQMNIILEELQNRRVLVLENRNRQESIPGSTEKKALIVANKTDLEGSAQRLDQLRQIYGEKLPIVPTSAEEMTGLDQLGAALFHTLDIIRVYTKAPGSKTDTTAPFILKKGSKVEEAAAAVHKDFRQQLKYAVLWGSGKYDGQRVKRGHILQDGDVLEFHV
ncbi:MAG: GTPase [Chloroflexota bacterium]|nr:GTPase [Chloroflexota bacterium]